MQDVDQLKHLLDVLYGPHASPHDQQQAQHHLFKAQQHEHAWQWPAPLLDQHDPTLRFFGAHTLALKISRDWFSLDETHHEQLKTPLLNWLAQSASLAYPKNGMPTPSERAVYRKLCVALSSLSLHLQPTQSWPDWMLDSTMTLSAASCTKEAVYELLVIVIEEASRADLIGKDKVSYDHSMSSAGEWVATSLLDSLHPTADSSPKLLDTAVACCSAWATSGHLTDQSMLDLYPLILHHLTHSPDNASAAGSCLEEWLLHNTTFFTPARIGPLLELCSGSFFSDMLFAARSEENVDDTALALIKLFLSVFEYSTDTIAQNLNSQATFAFLQHLIAIQSFPGHFPLDEQVSNLALSSWGLLQEALAEEGCLGPDKPEYAVSMEVFRAAADSIQTKCRWPEDAELSTWPKDTKDDFHSYRRDAGDALLNCYYVMRSTFLESLCSSTREQVQMINRGQSNVNALESSVFALRSIAEGVPHEESLPLQSVISSETLSALPPQPRLQQTALATIGEFAEWLGSNVPSQLPALQFVMNAFSDPRLSWAAATALFKICDTCRVALLPLAPDLVSVVGTLSSQNRLGREDFLKVVKSVASVLQALPPAEANVQIMVLCEPAFVDLESLASHANGAVDDEAEEACLRALGILSACASGLISPDLDLTILDGDSPEPPSEDAAVLAVRQRMLSSVQSTIGKYGSRVQVAIALSDLFKASAKSSQWSPLALDPLQLFLLCVEALQQEFSSVWLAVASNLPASIKTDELAKSAGHAYPMAIATCIQLVTSRLPSTEALEANPDVVQAFMSLMRELLRYAPDTMAQMPEALAALYDFSMSALGLQERVALQRTLGLLSACVQESATELPHAAIFRQLVLQRGQEAVFFIMSGIGGALPRSSLPFMTELLHAFVIKYPDQTRLWLTQMLGTENFPSGRLESEAKSRFLSRLLGCRTLRRARECVESFALQARGLQNTAYGMGSSAM